MCSAAVAIVATVGTARVPRRLNRQTAGSGRPNLSPAEEAKADSGRPPLFTAADVHFMQGMIGHHAQAIVIGGVGAHRTGPVPTMRRLAERIVVAQQDEIASMQRWLGEHHETVPDGKVGMMMPGMNMPMMMPGMLTPEQMAGTAVERRMARSSTDLVPDVHDPTPPRGA